MPFTRLQGVAPSHQLPCLHQHPPPLPQSCMQRESVREGAKEELAKRKSTREGLSKDAQRRLAALGGWEG